MAQNDSELEQILERFAVKTHLAKKGEDEMSNFDEATEAITAYKNKAVEEAKLGIVTNALNLLNTEPIHTVEQALLGDLQRLENRLKGEKLDE